MFSSKTGLHLIIVQGNTAVIEMESLSTALNGNPFNNTYCWVVNFENEVIVKVGAYVDCPSSKGN